MVDIRKVDRLEEDPRDEMLREMRAELDDFKIIARRLLADQPAPMPSREELEKRVPMLEPVADERQRFEAAWAAEPKVMVIIAPNADDERIRNDARARLRNPDLDYLPRTHQINGIQLHIPVGSPHMVPQSIADKIAYESNPWKARGITAPITFDQAEQRIGVA
jgi:hypothetical protein